MLPRGYTFLAAAGLLVVSSSPSSKVASFSLVTAPTTNPFRRATDINNVRSSSCSVAPSLTSTTATALFVKRIDSDEDYEQARTQFESMWTKQTRKQIVDPHQMRQYQDLLRQRHQQELRLLQSLEHSDSAVKDLIQLWSTHVIPPRGYDKSSLEPTSTTMTNDPTSEAAAAPNTLVRLQPSTLHPTTTDNTHAHANNHDDNEHTLLQLAQTHPEWAEPCLRLAALYWRNNQALPAYEWSLKGLENQPYHFVSSTMFMLLSIQQGHQAEVEYWSNMRLPKTFGPKRSQWVQRAIYECQDRFQNQSAEIQQILNDLSGKQQVATKQKKPNLESYVTVSAEMPIPERHPYGTGIHTNSGWAFSQPLQGADPNSLSPGSIGGPSSSIDYRGGGGAGAPHPNPGLSPFSGSFSPRPSSEASPLGGLAEPWHAPNNHHFRMRSEASTGPSSHAHFGGPSSAMPVRGDDGYVPPPPRQEHHHHHQIQPQQQQSSSSSSYWELEGLDDSGAANAWQ